MIDINIAKEDFNCNGNIMIIDENEIIVYEVLFNENKTFEPIEAGSCKFILRPDMNSENKKYGFIIHTKQKINYTEMVYEIENNYKDRELVSYLADKKIELSQKYPNLKSIIVGLSRLFLKLQYIR